MIQHEFSLKIGKEQHHDITTLWASEAYSAKEVNTKMAWGRCVSASGHDPRITTAEYPQGINYTCVTNIQM